MEIEKIFKIDGKSFMISVSLYCNSRDTIWSIGCYYREKGCRKWHSIPKTDVAPEWIVKTKDELLNKIDSAFQI